MALDLNYKPIALVDTSALAEEEWLAWRKKGIGGILPQPLKLCIG